MSEENKNKIRHIAPDAIIKLEMSGAFLDRLSFLLFNELRKYSEKDREDITKRMMNHEQSTSPEEDVLFALSDLIMSVRYNAKEQGLVTFKDPSITIEEMEKIMEKMPEYQPRGSQSSEDSSH